MVRIGEGDGKYYEDYKRDNPPAGSKKSGGSSGNIQDEYQKHLQETRSKYQETKEDAIARYNRMKKEAMSNYESFRNQAAADYENFRQQANSDYENFVQQAREEYENFANPDNDSVQDARDAANARYAEQLRQPWQEYKLEEAVPIPEIDDVGPVIYQDEGEDSKTVDAEEPISIKVIAGPPRGTNPEYDNAVHGYVEAKVEQNQNKTGLPIEQIPHYEIDKNGNPVDNYYDATGTLIKSVPHKSSNTETTQATGKTPSPVNTPGPDEIPKYEENTPEVQNKPEVTPQKVERYGVKGTYILTDGENGNGYRLQTDMTVSGFGEAAKFFRMNDNKGNGVYFDNDTQLYSFRGIERSSLSSLEKIMQTISQKLSINNAIYNDLLSKEKSGVELTNAEKTFMKSHIENIENYRLGLDNNGNLINISDE